MSDFLIPLKTNIEIAPGNFLISEPLLQDDHFQRSVVFLTDHTDTGSIGFILNKEMNMKLSDVVPELPDADFPVYTGGPLDEHALFMLHRIPHLLGGEHVVNDIFWGGDFQKLVHLIEQQQISYFDIRFFVGYSGWSGGQLQQEIDENTWIVANAHEEIIFETPITSIWKTSVQHLGDAYKPLLHMPLNPMFN